MVQLADVEERWLHEVQQEGEPHVVPVVARWQVLQRHGGKAPKRLYESFERHAATVGMLPPQEGSKIAFAAQRLDAEPHQKVVDALLCDDWPFVVGCELGEDR